MFDINQELFDEGELDESKADAYVDDLMEAFEASPEARPLLDSGAQDWLARNLMDFAFNYIGVNAAEMSLNHFNEILFDLFPRKMSTAPENASAIVEELRAFWRFVY